MTKTKQATLFSLKSWKNVAADNIQKYKQIISNLDETEAEILKALNSLKKKNPSRDVILSSRIDVSLELLEKHLSPIVCEEARLLRKLWQLNKDQVSEIIVISEEPPSKKCRRQTEIEICEMKTASKQPIECKQQSISQIQEKQIPNEPFLKTTMECLSLAPSKQSKICVPNKLQNEEFLKDIKESVPSAALIQTQTESKSPSVSRATYNNVMRQLCDAVKLFTQEVGEQEVRIYLERQFYSRTK